MKYLKSFFRRYRIYIIAIGVLTTGFFYKKRADAVRLASKKELQAAKEGKDSQPRTIMINLNLHGKTPEEKKKFLLNNFTMDCAIGDSSAKVTIVDFSSFDCKYCKKMRPEIKKIIQKYVVEDKTVRYALRPLFKSKNLSLGAFLQCSRYNERLDIAEELFSQDIDTIEDYESFIGELAEKYNMNEQYVKDCIYDEDLYEKIIYMQQSNKQVFNINATPMLIINGKRVIGYKNYDQIEKIVENFLRRGKNND